MTALDWFSLPELISSYRYKLPFVYLRADVTLSLLACLGSIETSLCWTAHSLTHLWEKGLLILCLHTYLSKALVEFQSCFVWCLHNFSNSVWILSCHFQKWFWSFWFILLIFFFLCLVFYLCHSFIFSRFSQASTQCLNCRSPTAQLVICVKGPLSSLCWSSSIPLCWRMTRTKETKVLKSSAGLPGMCVRVSRFSVTPTI